VRWRRSGRLLRPSYAISRVRLAACSLLNALSDLTLELAPHISSAATSQMFVTAPRTNDHLPATKNGALADTHVTAFQTAIDGLITAARSTAPTSTLGAMKPVILAMADISRDVEMFESRSAALRADVDAGELAELKDRSTTTLNALTQAAKEFAMSYGLSPISLLDAAASEVAASVVGLFKLLGIRREKKDVDYRSEFAAMQEAASDGGSEEETSIQPAGRSHGPRPTHSRQSSEGSNYDVRDSTLTAKPSVSTPPSPGDGSDHADGQNHRLTSTSSVGSTNSAFNLERKASLAETDASSLGSQKGWGGGGSSNKPAWDSRPTNGFRSPFDHGDEDHEDDGDADGEQAWRQLRVSRSAFLRSLFGARSLLIDRGSSSRSRIWTRNPSRSSRPSRRSSPRSALVRPRPSSARTSRLSSSSARPSLASPRTRFRYVR
jgi:hypothetical protein